MKKISGENYLGGETLIYNQSGLVKKGSWSTLVWKGQKYTCLGSSINIPFDLIRKD